MVKQTKRDWIQSQYPDEYDGCPFITIVHYARVTPSSQNDYPPFVAIVDNVTDSHLLCYNLDIIRHDERDLFDVALEWHNDGHMVPLSLYVSQHGLSDVYNHCYQSLMIKGIVKTIGPIYKTTYACLNQPKRRRIKPKDNRTLTKYEF